MASNLYYTLQDLMDRINTLVENDNDTPESTDDEWETRLNLINQSIGKWESQDVFWDELWTSYTHGSTVSTATTYSLSSLTDMRFPGGYLQLILNGATTYIPIVSPEEYQTYGGSARVAYFTGNNSAGWTLNLGWTPADGDGTYGATIKIFYYKFATRFTTASATTAKSELSDPNFIVYDVAAAKSLMESKNNQYSVYSVEALTCMDKMRAINEMKPNYQNMTLDDVDAISYNAVIGD